MEKDIYKILEYKLQEIMKQFYVVPLDLQELRRNFTTYIPKLFHLRLNFLELQIMTQVLSLYIKHQTKGQVFLMDIGIGLVVYWTENPDIIANADWLSDRGTLLFLNEFLKKTHELEAELLKGNLPEFVKRINDWNFIGLSD